MKLFNLVPAGELLDAENAPCTSRYPGPLPPAPHNAPAACLPTRQPSSSQTPMLCLGYKSTG